MTESTFWSSARKHLAPYGRFVRIEDRTGASGVPDVYYCIRGKQGWIELKHIDEPPTRITSTLRVKHLTLDQVTWLNDEAKAGGRAWVLLQVGRAYILGNPEIAQGIYHHQLTMLDLKEKASVFQIDKFPTVEIIKCLMQ